LIELYSAPYAQRHAMGLAARERIRDVYHPDRIAREFEQLYNGYIGIEDQSSIAEPRTTKVQAESPAVAVIIPCFNHGKYIRETITSVEAQDWPHVEIVIVDDGSTDEETLQVLAKLKAERYRIIRQENQGLAAARNTGVRLTDAPFFVPLDADDRIAPDFISKLIAPLMQDASLGYCYSHVTFFGAADGVWPCATYDPRKILVENLSVATAVIRRSAFDAVGGYSREMIYGFEDWDFWLALLSTGYHGRCIAEPLFFYRKHPRGQSMLDKTQKHRAEMVHKMIEHHRSLFATMLEVSLTDKDSMFFQAHMQAAYLREAVAKHDVAVSAQPVEDELYQALMAQAQLDHIENSNTWRFVQRIKRNAFYRFTASLRFGPEWERIDPNEGPRERLARIQASRFYRLIRTTKQSALYKWYARRKYGPDFADPLNAR
jgi:glycosyltransferase involved in cell wall biosynthesis